MNNEVYQIYDRIFKRIFTLSNLSIINMINGLFHTNYPTESIVEYPNKEFVNRFLKERFADVFISINSTHTYHLEAQIQKDENIVIRVFEYGVYHAVEHMDDKTILKFPEPVVIYLTKESSIPEESVLILDFGKQGSFEYKVENYIYLNHDVIELNQRKMGILIPFQLLKFKEIIHKNPTRKNFEKLQRLLENDILKSIEANVKVGNITQEDATQLLELTRQLYKYLYDNYYEIGGCEDMKPLLDGAMELPLDKYRIRIDELEGKLASEKERADKMSVEAERLRKELEELKKNK